MLKKLLLGLVVLIVALCGVIATRPATFTIQRSATFKATPDVPFALVNDFHQWGQWSPWEKLDPAQKKTFTGAAQGTGSSYAWEGNDKVGAGRMTIEESKPNELVRLKLEFLKPFASTSDTRFTFAPAADGVTVTWTMAGENNFMSKAFSMVMDMDAMVGKDFETGLATLRELSEVETQKRAAARAAQLAAEAQPAPSTGQVIAAPTP